MTHELTNVIKAQKNYVVYHVAFSNRASFDMFSQAVQDTSFNIPGNEVGGVLSGGFRSNQVETPWAKATTN